MTMVYCDDVSRVGRDVRNANEISFDRCYRACYIVEDQLASLSMSYRFGARDNDETV